jgi:hypothetical protein
VLLLCYAEVNTAILYLSASLGIIESCGEILGFTISPLLIPLLAVFHQVLLISYILNIVKDVVSFEALIYSSCLFLQITHSQILLVHICYFCSDVSVIFNPDKKKYNSVFDGNN